MPAGAIKTYYGFGANAFDTTQGPPTADPPSAVCRAIVSNPGERVSVRLIQIVAVPASISLVAAGALLMLPVFAFRMPGNSSSQPGQLPIPPQFPAFGAGRAAFPFGINSISGLEWLWFGFAPAGVAAGGPSGPTSWPIDPDLLYADDGQVLFIMATAASDQTNGGASAFYDTNVSLTVLGNTKQKDASNFGGLGRGKSIPRYDFATPNAGRVPE